MYKVGDAYTEFVFTSLLSKLEDGEGGEWDALIQCKDSPAIYMIRHGLVDGMFQILAAQVFGESSDDHMLRVKFPLARGKMSVDINPVRAELASPRYASFEDWPTPRSSAVQLPLSMIKIRKNREHGEERGGVDFPFDGQSQVTSHPRTTACWRLGGHSKRLRRDPAPRACAQTSQRPLCVPGLN